MDPFAVTIAAYQIEALHEIGAALNGAGSALVRGMRNFIGRAADTEFPLLPRRPAESIERHVYPPCRLRYPHAGEVCGCENGTLHDCATGLGRN